MAVRSAELGRLVWSGAGSQTLFTVPSGETWILKDLRLASAHTAAFNFLVFVSDGTTPHLVMVVPIGVGPAATGVLPWLVLEPGYSLVIVPTVTPTGGAIAYASGAMLAGVA